MGIRVETADDFPSILALVKYVQQVCEASTGAQLEDQIQRLKCQQTDMEVRMASELTAALAQMKLQYSANESMSRAPLPRRTAPGVNTISEWNPPGQRSDYAYDNRYGINPDFRDNNSTIQESTGYTLPVNSNKWSEVSELPYKNQHSDHLRMTNPESDNYESFSGIYVGPVFQVYSVNTIQFPRTLKEDQEQCIARLG